MFFLPASLLCPSSEAERPRRIRPRAAHKWPWQINSISPSERISWAHEQASKSCISCEGKGFRLQLLDDDVSQAERLVCSCRYRPISIVARFDSYFPWPVNLIHHYLLEVPIQCLREPQESPYILPPKLLHTVPSTVRLFGHSVLTIGRYGELVWTDSECADDSGEAFFLEGTGERLSGSKLPLPHPDAEEHLPDIASLSLNAAEPSILQPPSSDPAPAQVSGSVSTLQMSQFATRLSDGWFSLSLCERAGRIAVGDGSGLVEVFDYI